MQSLLFIEKWAKQHHCLTTGGSGVVDEDENARQSILQHIAMLKMATSPAGIIFNVVANLYIITPANTPAVPRDK